MEEAVVVSLESIVALDPTLALLADLRPGWCSTHFEAAQSVVRV